MSRIFLSHSSSDNFEAVGLRDWLAEEGWEDVFLDIDPVRGIEAGQRWERRLHEAASRCEAVVFLVSAQWLASAWCLKEYTVARRLNKKLFAVLIDPTKSMKNLPDALTDTWQVVDLVGGQDTQLLRIVMPGSHEEKHLGFSRSGLRRLRRGLQKAGLDPRFFAWPPEREPDRAPYRGLKPLDASDAGILFGRDAPIVDATDRLRGLGIGAAPRLMVILGASGAGKSSFLRAGLLPRLARDDAHFVPLPPIRPERAALTGENGLLRALEVACPARTRHDLRAAMKAGAAGLRPILAELAQQTFRQTLAEDGTTRPPSIVLAIDQAEELFRAEGAEESQALLGLVGELAAVDDPVAVIVIFAIRSDSYDALERAKALEGSRLDTIPLLPMPRGAYKDVIEGPARRASEGDRRLAIEPQLTERLLADIEAGGGSDSLPLLAFALEQLYLEYHRAGVMRSADYEAIGGLGGAIDRAVERAFARADFDPRIPRERSAREAQLRRGLIPWLCGIDPDTRSPRRNIARLADIPVEAAPLIDLLVEERLLSVDTRRGRDPASGEEVRIATIEPTHEALLRQWGLLDGWLAEDFGLLATLEGVRRAARDWIANGRYEAWLPHQGQRLAEARRLDARPDIASKLDEGDRAYLSACAEREAVQRDADERRRREKEERQAKSLHDARTLAAANRKVIVRTRAGLCSALALTIIALVFGYLGYSGQQAALVQASIAKAKTDDAVKAQQQSAATGSQALAMASRLAMADRHVLDSLRLAIESWPRKRDSFPRLQTSLDAMANALADSHPLLAEAKLPNKVDGFDFIDRNRIVFRVSGDDPTLCLLTIDVSGLRCGSTHRDAAVWSFWLDRDMPRANLLFSDGAVTSWDPTSGAWRDEPLRSIPLPVGCALQVIAPGTAAAICENGDIGVWNARDGTRIGSGFNCGCRLSLPDTFVTSNPSLSLIAVRSSDRRKDTSVLRVFSVASGRELFRFDASRRPYGGFFLRGLKGEVLAYFKDREVCFQDLARSGDPAEPVGRPVCGVADLHGLFNEWPKVVDDKLVYHNQDVVQIWDASTKSLVQQYSVAGNIREVQCRSLCRNLYIGLEDGTVLAVKSSQRIEDAVKIVGHRPIRHFRILPNADALLLFDDLSAYQWDIGMVHQIGSSFSPESRVESGLFFAQWTRFLAISPIGEISVWDSAAGSRLDLVQPFPKGALEARDFLFFDDGTVAVWAGADLTFRHAENGAAIGPVARHEGIIAGVVESNKGGFLSWTDEGTVSLWDRGAVEPRFIGKALGRVAFSVMSPDRRFFAYATAGKTGPYVDLADVKVAVMSTDDGGLACPALPFPEGVQDMKFSADGNDLIIVSATYGRPRYSVFSIKNCREDQNLRTLSSIASVVEKIVVDPTGRRLVTLHHNGTSCVWTKTEQGQYKEVNCFRTELDFAKGGGLFSPSGKKLILYSNFRYAVLPTVDLTRPDVAFKILGFKRDTNSVDFISEGRMLIRQEGGRAAVLDLESGEYLLPPYFQKEMEDIKMSKDKRNAVSIDQSGHLNFWNNHWSEGGLIELACHFAGAPSRFSDLNALYGIDSKLSGCEDLQQLGGLH